MTEPHYDICTLTELEDALAHIDKERFPERTKQIEHFLRLRRSGVEPSDSKYRCPICNAGLDEVKGPVDPKLSTGLTAAFFAIALWLASPILVRRREYQCSKCGFKLSRAQLNKSLQRTAGGDF